MPTRQKVLGLPIGRRRKSRIPKAVAGGGAALVLAVPAVVKGTKLVRPVQEKIKKVEDLTDKASDLAGPVRTASHAIDTIKRAGSAVTGGLTGSAGESGDEQGSQGNRTPDKGVKTMNIVEKIDVGAPLHTTYDVWTRFTDFPAFMKKVRSVEQESDETLNWTARIAWSNRTWKAKILEQVPDRKIVWRSEGSKGYVDGAVTFHELAPELTRVVVVLEYHPQGLFEKTGNVWRAQGRRARLELKNFERHVMTEVALSPEPPEGWRGEIHEGSVIESQQSDAADEDEPQGPDEADERSDEADSDGDPRAERDRDDERGAEPEEEEEEDEEEEPEKHNGQVQASERSQSRPVRRRQSSSEGDGDGDGDDKGTPSTAPRGSRSSKSDEQAPSSLNHGKGRSGRVVGNRSERRVGQK